MSPEIKAFTSAYPSFSNVLKNNVLVHQAFDPNGQKVPPGFDFVALWDTGATNTVITQNVVDACGLSPVNYATVFHANGSCLAEVYLVAIMLPNGAGFSSVRVTKGDLSGEDLLIGMDIIGAGDFAVSNANGKTVFTYRSPSVARIDFWAEIKKPGIISGRVGRNSACPCGSGKKFKQCCGK